MVHSVHTVRCLYDTCSNVLVECHQLKGVEYRLIKLKKQVTCLVRWNMYKLYLNGWKWINKDVFSRIWKTRMWKLVGLFDIFTYLRDL